jgi:FdhD protein
VLELDAAILERLRVIAALGPIPSVHERDHRDPELVNRLLTGRDRGDRVGERAACATRCREKHEQDATTEHEEALWFGLDVVVERIRAFEITRLRSGEPIKERDRVAVEEPLEIRVNGAPLAVVMRTPGHDVDLVAGLLLAEEVVRSTGDLLTIAACDENVVEVQLTGSTDTRRAERSLLTSSSCGVCGKRTIESLHASAPAFEHAPEIDPELISLLPDRLREVQELFAETGGLHGAAVFDQKGELVVVREDVGRHNAVDKCLGHLFLRERLPLTSVGLIVSGRVSFEIVQKALVARVPLIAAVSAPSSLAVELARASNMALVGFVRGGGFNVYAGAL